MQFCGFWSFSFDPILLDCENSISERGQTFGRTCKTCRVLSLIWLSNGVYLCRLIIQCYNFFCSSHPCDFERKRWQTKDQLVSLTEKLFNFTHVALYFAIIIHTIVRSPCFMSSNDISSAILCCSYEQVFFFLQKITIAFPFIITGAIPK